jgi:hypothetical protein
MRSQETRNKISATMKGRPLTSEHRANLKAAVTPEQKKKRSDRMKAYWASKKELLKQAKPCLDLENSKNSNGI